MANLLEQAIDCDDGDDAAKVIRNAPRLIAREQTGGRAPSGFGLEIHVSQRLPVVVADDETTAVVFLCVPGGGKRRGAMVIPGRWAERLGNELRPSATRR